MYKNLHINTATSGSKIYFSRLISYGRGLQPLINTLYSLDMLNPFFLRRHFHCLLVIPFPFIFLWFLINQLRKWETSVENLVNCARYVRLWLNVVWLFKKCWTLNAVKVLNLFRSEIIMYTKLLQICLLRSVAESLVRSASSSWSSLFSQAKK